MFGAGNSVRAVPPPVVVTPGTSGAPAEGAVENQEPEEAAAAIAAAAQAQGEDVVVHVADVAVGATSRSLSAGISRFAESATPGFITELELATTYLESGNFVESDAHLQRAVELMASGVESASNEQKLLGLRLEIGYLVQLATCFHNGQVDSSENFHSRIRRIRETPLRISGNPENLNTLIRESHDLKSLSNLYAGMLSNAINRPATGMIHLTNLLQICPRKTIRGMLDMIIALNSHRAHVFANINIPPYLTLSQDKLDILFRILNNLVTNASEHPAQGRRKNIISILIIENTISVLDRGSGMTPETLGALIRGARIHDGQPVEETSQRGIGWLSVRRLAKQIGLRLLALDSEPSYETVHETVVAFDPEPVFVGLDNGFVAEGGFWDIDFRNLTDDDLNANLPPHILSNISLKSKEALVKRILGLPDSTLSTWNGLSSLTLTPGPGDQDLRVPVDTRRESILRRLVITVRPSTQPTGYVVKF